MTKRRAHSKRNRKRNRKRLLLEQLEDRRLLAGLPAHDAFDFGTKNSPVASDYVQVTHRDRFDAEIGYGWLSGAINAKNRRQGDDLRRDDNRTMNGEFGVDLPSGDYRVELLLGDLGRRPHDHMGVFLEDIQVDEVTTDGGEVVQREYDVTVSDGRLNLRLQDLGGRDRVAVLQSMRIIPLNVTPAISIADASVIEGDSGASTLRFAATLSNPTDKTVSVSFATSNGSATAGSDYLSTSGTIQFAPGETVANIDVPVHGDEEPEGAESLLLQLVSPVHATLGNAVATGSILNDDIAPTLTLLPAPAIVSESAGASPVTITRSGSVSEPLAVTIGHDTNAITAPSVVHFAAGEAQTSFEIQVHDNDDWGEDVAVTLQAAASGYLPTQTTLLVADDEAPPFSAFYDFGAAGSPVAHGAIPVAANSYTAARGFGWTSGHVSSANRNRPDPAERDFNFVTDGSFRVDLPNGFYEVEITMGDLGKRDRDNMAVHLEGRHVDTVTARGRQVVTNRYLVEVTDGRLDLRLDDLGGVDQHATINSMSVVAAGPPLPTIDIGNVDIVEGDAGSTQIVFVAALSAPSDETISVEFATVDGEAVAGADYASASGVVEFAPGETEKQIVTTVFGDTIPEDDERFYVSLNQPTNANLGISQGTGAILNDDIIKSLSLQLAADSVAESGQTTATLHRTGDASAAIDVSLLSTNPDWVSVPSTATFGAGATSTTFPVTIADDDIVNGNRVVAISATAPNYVAGSANLTVVDDEAPEFVGYYDFGSTTSPVAPNYTRVTDQDLYQAARGYGWTAGAPRSANRNGGSLDRDIVWSQDLTFQVDVPNGLYRVDLLLGDRGSVSRDKMRVYAEGVFTDEVNTERGGMVAVTTTVNVTDGALSIRLQDGGGRDNHVSIAALRIYGAEVDPHAAWWPVRDGIEGVFSQPRHSNGLVVYDVETPYQTSKNNIRVLLPSDYSTDQLYRVVYVLPVELGNRTQFGDGLATLRTLGLADQHDVIFVTPSFSQTPWFVDHATRQDKWQETYFREVVVPFVEQEFSVSGDPADRLLLGFSKSGVGALAMLLRTPEAYGGAVVWDAPIAMENPSEGWDFLATLGSRENYEQNYRITNLLPSVAHAFQGGPVRISLLGYSYNSTRQDHAEVDQLMTQLGIPHHYEVGVKRNHVWASGWMPDAVDAVLNPPIL